MRISETHTLNGSLLSLFTWVRTQRVTSRVDKAATLDTRSIPDELVLCGYCQTETIRVMMNNLKQLLQQNIILEMCKLGIHYVSCHAFRVISGNSQNNF
jgi:hypothetical protein